ncbi:Rib/alpha-like domain-containing protein, partial [Helcococcus bovis]
MLRKQAKKCFALALAFFMILGFLPINKAIKNVNAEQNAIYSPGSNNQKRGYQGRAWIENGNSIYGYDKGVDKPVANHKIYLQWINGEGFVSPIYYTTTNEDGTFYFDLSKPVENIFGQAAVFEIAGDSKFKIRTWSDELPGYSAVVSGDDYYSGAFRTRLQRVRESWDFTVGVNRIVGSEFIWQKNQDHTWMVKPEAEWKVHDNTDLGNYGRIKGTLWYEGNALAGSPKQQLYSGNARDVFVAGVKVVASYVNDDVAKLFDEWKKNHPNANSTDFANAQKEIIEKYDLEKGVKGAAIAETVVTTTGENGEYYIPFNGLYGVDRNKQNSGAKVSWKVSGEEYGKVVTEEDRDNSNLMKWNGTIGQKHRHINKDYLMVKPLVKNYDLYSLNFNQPNFKAVDGYGVFNASSDNIYNVNFALTTPKPMHDVLVYDSISKFAGPGDSVENETSGLIPNENYTLAWFARSEDGTTKLVKTEKFVSSPDGTINSYPITVPGDIKGVVTYFSTVYFGHVDNPSFDDDFMLVDSFIATNIDRFIYQDAEVKKGSEKTNLAPTGDNLATKDIVEKNKAPEGTKFKLDPGLSLGDGNDKVEVRPPYNVPEGYQVSVNETTGEVTVKVPDTVEAGTEIEIPVLISVPVNTGDKTIYIDQVSVAKFIVTENLPDVIPGTQEKPEGYVTVTFINDNNKGTMEGETSYHVNPKVKVQLTTPKITPKAGYEYKGWDKGDFDLGTHTLEGQFTQDTDINVIYRSTGFNLTVEPKTQTKIEKPGQATEIDKVVVKADKENINYELVNAPQGLNIDPATGEITGTVPSVNWANNDHEEEKITVTVKGTDQDGLETLNTFDIIIQRDTDGDGEPDLADKDDDGDGFTDDEEKDKGSNPKDKN